MEIIVYLLLQLGILFGNPTTTQNPTSPVKTDQVQKVEMNSLRSNTTINRDGGSGTWGENG